MVPLFPFIPGPDSSIAKDANRHNAQDNAAQEYKVGLFHKVLNHLVLGHL
jgi:hypothetical protein